MRNIHSTTLVALAAAALSGCAGTFDTSILRPPSNSLPWDSPGKASLCSHSCTQDDANNALIKAASYCLSIYNYHGRYAGAAGAAQWSLGSLGILAGSVLSPLSHGSAAKAWAGLSGATNALQLSMNDAFSATVELNRQKEVTNAVNAGMKNYVEAPDVEKQMSAAVVMSVRCAMAGALADANTLIKLTGPAPASGTGNGGGGTDTSGGTGTSDGTGTSGGTSLSSPSQPKSK